MSEEEAVILLDLLDFEIYSIKKNEIGREEGLEIFEKIKNRLDDRLKELQEGKKYIVIDDKIPSWRILEAGSKREARDIALYEELDPVFVIRVDEATTGGRLWDKMYPKAQKLQE